MLSSFPSVSKILFASSILPPEQMTLQDWEEVYEIEYQWAEERYQSFQKKLHDVMGDKKINELTEEEHKKLEEIIDNDIENKY